MTFGKILRQLRERDRYSMDKLVELYNTQFNGKMNKSTLSRYENELQEPMYTVIVNLAKIFNVTVDYLSGAADCPGAFPENISAHDKRLIAAYHSKPHLQPAVDKLLGIDDDGDIIMTEKISPIKKETPAIAAFGGGGEVSGEPSVDDIIFGTGGKR